MASRFSISAVFKGVDKISRPVSRMGNRISQFTRRSEKHVKRLGKSFKKLGGVISKTAKTAAIVGVGALSLALVDAGKQAITFEQTMVNAATKFGPEVQKGTNEFKLLSEAARKTGKETEFTANQSAKALNLLGLAGFNLRQSISALPGVVDLATAAELDLAEATEIATKTLGIFQLKTKDPIQLDKNLTRVNDVLAKTATSTSTTIQQLFEAISEAGPIAKTAGISMETLAATIGSISEAETGGKAGTSMKNIITRITAPVAEGLRVLKKLGLRAKKDKKGNFDLLKFMGELEGKLKGFDKIQKTAILNKIFGKIPLAAVSVLFAKTAKEVGVLETSLENANGTSKKMAATMRDTMQGRINSLISAFEGLQLTVFGLQDGAMSGLIDKSIEMVRAFDQAIFKNRELGNGIVTDIINTVTGAAKVVGILIAGFVLLKTAVLVQQTILLGYGAAILFIKGLMIAWKVVVIAFTAAQWLLNIALNANPIGLFVAGIGLLIAAGALLLTFWEPITDFFVGMWDKIGNAFSTGINFVMGIIKPFQDAFSGIGGLFEKFGIVFGGEKKDEETRGGATLNGQAPQVISPQERISKSIEQQISESKSTLTIKDESGRAELKEGKRSNGVNIRLATSGGF